MRAGLHAGFGVVLLGLASCGGDDFSGVAYMADFGPLQVASGVEDVRCVTLDLGNDRPVRIQQIRNTLSSAGVQLIVYAVENGTVNSTPTSCTPFINPSDTEATPLMLTMRPQETLTLPTGVGFTLNAHQKVRLQLQYLNKTAGSVDVTASAEFRTMPESAFEQEAGFVVAGNMNLNIPPGPGYGVFRWIPYPAAFGGVHVFAVTGLTHKLGTGVEASWATGQASTMNTLYQPAVFTWDAPPVASLNPEVVLPLGGGIRLACNYNNTTNATVSFGADLSHEICYLGAYYYPKQSPTVIF